MKSTKNKEEEEEKGELEHKEVWKLIPVSNGQIVISNKTKNKLGLSFLFVVSITVKCAVYTDGTKYQKVFLKVDTSFISKLFFLF